MLVLRNTQQKYHGIVGVAVDDIASVGDEVWEQAISKLKKRYHFRTLGSGEKGYSAVVRWCRQQMDPWETEKGAIGSCQYERKKLPCDRCWELSVT